MLGFAPKVILLRSDELLDAVEALIPHDCYVTVSLHWDLDLMDALEPYKCVAFVDCRLRRSGLTICERLHVHWILSTWPSTLREACWQSRTVEVSHLSSRGVTDRKLQIIKWTPMTDPRIHSQPQMVRVPRDAITILDAAMFARGSRCAPVAQRLFPVQSLNLGSTQDPIWHSGGLLPAHCDRRTRVLTPCISLPLTVEIQYLAPLSSAIALL
jgi:hypothetical protein